MKNSLFRWIICVTVLMPCFISCSKMHPPSRFLNSFSLDETIKRMNLQGIAPSSASMSSSASAGDPSPYRHEFHLEMIIPQPVAGNFDEQDFLAKLQQQITQEAAASGVKVSGDGSSEGDFYIDYRDGEHNGGVEVIGVRTEGNEYEVWCIIRELAANGAGQN
jgi:hypothetical protein